MLGSRLISRREDREPQVDLPAACSFASACSSDHPELDLKLSFLRVSLTESGCGVISRVPAARPGGLSEACVFEHLSEVFTDMVFGQGPMNPR